MQTDVSKLAAELEQGLYDDPQTCRQHTDWFVKFLSKHGPTIARALRRVEKLERVYAEMREYSCSECGVAYLEDDYCGEEPGECCELMRSYVAALEES